MKRRSIVTGALAAAALLAAFVASRGLMGDERADPAAPPLAAPQGLVLVAEPIDGDTLRPGPLPQVRLRIENRSKTATHPVILPGDGSSDGRREPWIRWSATLQPAGGAPRDLVREPNDRVPCKQFDYDWRKSVVLLAPGEQVELRDWLPLIGEDYEAQDAGTLRLVARYSYRRVPPGGRPDAPAAFGQMGDAPAFDLVSAPVAFRVVRPLDVVVARGASKPRAMAGTAARLGDLLDVRVVNRSAEPFDLPAGQWTTTFEVADEAKAGWLAPAGSGPGADRAVSLAPGASAVIAGASVGTVGFRESGTFLRPGIVRVRAAIVVAGMRVRSQWTELTIDPAPGAADQAK
jgi:hypothetical protein